MEDFATAQNWQLRPEVESHRSTLDLLFGKMYGVARAE